jgi:hypothetical protein
MGVPSEKHDHPVRRDDLDIDVKNGTIQDGKADAALDFLRTGDNLDATEVDEKTLVRKIDWMIMPLMWAAYNLQYLDKVLSRCSIGSTKMPSSKFHSLILRFQSQLRISYGIIERY